MVVTKIAKGKKNIAGQILTYNSKNFHWLIKKQDIERTMSELGNPFLKKLIQKKKKEKNNVKMSLSRTKNH